MKRDNLISEIKILGNSLQVIANWEGTDQPFGYIEANKEELGKGKNLLINDAYLYEFYCLSQILKSLNNNNHGFEIGVRKYDNNEINELKLPLAPARIDKGYTFFTLKKGTEIYVLYGGIRLESESGVEKAPDISILRCKDKNDLPYKYNAIEQIFDAKFTTSTRTKKASENQYNDFSAMVRLFDLDKNVSKGLLNNINKIEVSGNFIITNVEKFRSATNPKFLDKFKTGILDRFAIDMKNISYHGYEIP